MADRRLLDRNIFLQIGYTKIFIAISLIFNVANGLGKVILILFQDDDTGIAPNLAICSY